MSETAEPTSPSMRHAHPHSAHTRIPETPASAPASETSSVASTEATEATDATIEEPPPLLPQPPPTFTTPKALLFGITNERPVVKRVTIGPDGAAYEHTVQRVDYAPPTLEGETERERKLIEDNRALSRTLAATVDHRKKLVQGIQGALAADGRPNQDTTAFVFESAMKALETHHVQVGSVREVVAAVIKSEQSDQPFSWELAIGQVRDLACDLGKAQKDLKRYREMEPSKELKKCTKRFNGLRGAAMSTYRHFREENVARLDANTLRAHIVKAMVEMAPHLK